MGVSFAAVGAKTPGVLLVPAVAYYAGGPIIRAVHHDGGGWSLLRRFTFPLAGGLAGAAIGSAFDHGHRDCAEGCASLFVGLIGGSAGATAAMIYDWVSAREPAPSGSPTPLAWTPVVVATPRIQAVGFALRF